MVGWHHRLNGHEFEQVPGDVKDKEDWHAAVHGVTKSQTRLSDFTSFHFSSKSLQMVIAAMKLKDVYSLEGKL